MFLWFAFNPPIRRSVPQRVLSLSILVIVTIAGACLLAYGLSGGNLAEALRYYLLDIPADQFWYFGTPPNKFIHNLVHLTDKKFFTPIALGLASFACVRYVYLKEYIDKRTYGLCFYLLLYPLIAFSLTLWGIFVSRYSWQLRITALYVFIFCVSKLIQKRFH